MIKYLFGGLASLGLIVGGATAADAAGNVNVALSVTGAFTHTSQHSAFQIDNAAGLVVGR